MASMNKVILLGNLTRDPELRYAPNGTAVARLGLAVNHRYRQHDADKEETMFIDVVAFGRQGETASEHLSTGRPVLIEGRLQWRTWEGQDGRKHSKHEVLAERIQFLGTRQDGNAAPEARTGTSGGAGVIPPLDDDDIPFVRADLPDVPPRAHRTPLT
jgi:single-strand DNA-binding protein